LVACCKWEMFRLKSDADLKRCDAYVANVSQVELKDRLSIVAELWRAGIKADLQYDDERTIETLETECLEQNTL